MEPPSPSEGPHSLDPLPSHNLQHLLRPLLVQTSPSVPIPNIRLNIERGRRQPRIGLCLESREGGVVSQSREERLDGVGDVGDERGSVPEGHCVVVQRA